MTETTIDRVRKLVVDHLDCDPTLATETAKITEDLGGDSLDHVELIMGLEEEFNIQILDGEAAGLETIGAIGEFVDRKLSSMDLT